MLVFNTKDDLTTLIVVSRSLLALQLSWCVFGLKRDPSPINRLGTMGREGRRQQLPAHAEVPRDKSRKAPLNAIFILFSLIICSSAMVWLETGREPALQPGCWHWVVKVVMMGSKGTPLQSRAYGSQMVMKCMLTVSINKCRSSLPDGIMGFMIIEGLNKTLTSKYPKSPSVQNYSFCDEQQISCSYWLHSPLKM